MKNVDQPLCWRKCHLVPSSFFSSSHHFQTFCSGSSFFLRPPLTGVCGVEAGPFFTGGGAGAGFLADFLAGVFFFGWKNDEVNF